MQAARAAHIRETGNSVKRQAEASADISPKKTYRWPVKSCLTLLIIWEMEIKTTVRHHLTPVRMAIIKNLQTVKAGRMLRKWNPPLLSVQLWTGAVIMENSTEAHQQERKKSALWPSSRISGHIPWENHNSERRTYPNFTAALFTIAKTWKQLKCPSTDGRIMKIWYI